MNASHVLHLEPAWRDKSDFIIDAKLEDGMPRAWEQLWAKQIGPRQFEICCIPFFLYDLGLGDLVETGPPGDEEYVMRRLIRSAGHQTFRVWFKGTPDPTVRQEVLSELGRLGCLLEWSSENLLAIDAATNEIAKSLGGFLSARHQASRLVYEAARLE
jgi:hypothetical protein